MSNEFFKSTQCNSGKYCHICRNKSKTSFRNTVNKRYSDVNEVNFVCPFKKDWGYQKPDDGKNERKEVVERTEVLAKHRERQKINEEKKKKKALYDQKIRDKELIGLNFKYIYKHEEIFGKIDGYQDEKDKINAAVKKAEDAGKCSSCTRNRLNRSIERFVVKNLEQVVDELPNNILLPLSTPMTTKEYKASIK